TRSQGQKPACKDLRRNGQSPTITPEAMNSLLRP
ncbi:Malolactic regulator, partial [Lactobacillus acidophilus]|nr:Malolactic regulator [Lactobacillus acidophilus]